MQGLEAVESDENDMLCAAIGVICDDLEVAQAEGTS
jgi:formylmethanofuran dehydrogenase subunit B